MENQLYFYYKDPDVIICYMRQNGQLELMNIRQ
jgi:hypothetical protein